MNLNVDLRKNGNFKFKLCDTVVDLICLYFQISDWTGVAFQDKKYTSKLHFLNLFIAWLDKKL